jgi:hypothetical protein
MARDRVTSGGVEAAPLVTFQFQGIGQQTDGFPLRRCRLPSLQCPHGSFADPGPLCQLPLGQAQFHAVTSDQIGER